MVKGGRNLVIHGGGNGIGEETYEEVNLVERGHRSRLRLSSLCADCDDYMVAYIDYFIVCEQYF